MAFDKFNKISSVTKKSRFVCKEGNNGWKGTNELSPFADLPTALAGNGAVSPTPLGESLTGAITANETIYIESGTYAELLPTPFNAQNNLSLIGYDEADTNRTKITQNLTVGSSSRLTVQGVQLASLTFNTAGATTTNHKFHRVVVVGLTTITSLNTGWIRLDNCVFMDDIDCAGMAPGTKLMLNFPDFQNGAQLINVPAGVQIFINNPVELDLSQLEVGSGKGLGAGTLFSVYGGHVGAVPADLTDKLLADMTVINFQYVTFRNSTTGAMLQPARSGTCTAYLKHCDVASPTSSLYNTWTDTAFSVYNSTPVGQTKFYSTSAGGSEDIDTRLTAMAYVMNANDVLRIRNTSSTLPLEFTTVGAFSSFEQLNESTATSLIIPPLTTIDLVYTGTASNFEVANAFGQQGLSAETVLAANANLSAVVADMEIGDTVIVRATTPVTITAAAGEVINNWDGFVGNTSTVISVPKLAVFFKTGINTYTLQQDLGVATTSSNLKDFAATSIFKYNYVDQRFNADTAVDASLMTEELDYRISNRHATNDIRFTISNSTLIDGYPADFDTVGKVLILSPHESCILTKTSVGASIKVDIQG